MNALTDALIAAVPPGTKALNDGQRLMLYFTATGLKAWRLEYRTVDGKDTMKALGNYPVVSINKARALAEDVRKAAASAVPGELTERTERKPKAIRATLRQIGAAYIPAAPGRGGKLPNAGTVKKRNWGFDEFHKLHGQLWTDVRGEDLRAVITALMANGKTSKAKYCKELLSSIFESASDTYGVEYNPISARKTKLWGMYYKPEPHAAIVDPKRFGILAALLDSWDNGAVANATRLMMRAVARQQAFREARWEIPAEAMKMGVPHVVRLSPQCVAILRSQTAISPYRAGQCVFPNVRNPGEGLSYSAIANYLETLGYESAEQTPHGFRTCFATLAREAGKDDRLIEMCMAHTDPNKVRAAYDRSESMDARRELMNWWSDHIEQLKAAAEG